MNYLSKNIRYLRKSKKWSQEKLAKRLGVKRSSIAAYERKNVRPRLDFIVGLSKMFNIRISDLIEKDIEGAGGLEKVENGFNTSGSGTEAIQQEISKIKLDIENEASVEKFVERSVRIRKMLEGFKVFYKFKLESFDDLSEDARRLTADIENFLLLMEHLLAHNEAIIRAISKEGMQSKS